MEDESTDEEGPRPQTKEAEDIDMLHSWMQVGGFLPDLGERHGGFCWRWVCCLFFIWLSIPLYICTLVFLFPFIFQGLFLLKRASSL